MRKYIFTALTLSLFALQIKAQTIERKLIGTAGDIYENGSGRLSFSLGETVAEYYLLQTHLCQGFQQSEFVDMPLPLGLVDFGGYRMDEKSVELNWQMFSQTDLDYFILERKKVEEEDFKSVGRIDSQSSKVYEKVDFNPSTKNSYYRLKCYAKDGSFQYSNVVLIEGVPLKNVVSAAPNPTDGSLTLTLAPDVREMYSELNLSISNSQGQILHQQQISLNGQSLTISQLRDYPAGVYYFTIETDTNYREFLKVIKSVR